jgi:hypothetical protein
MKDFITHFMYERTGRSPIVIPVINIIDGKVDTRPISAISTEERVNKEQQRFAEIRARLLG